MNYLDKIKNAMKPKLHEVEINGLAFWVHRPSMKDLANCDTLAKTIILCVKDENGDQIFAEEDIDGRVNVNELDFKYTQELYMQVMSLAGNDALDEIEKK